MNRALARAIVESLAVGPTAGPDLSRLAGFAPREWPGTLRWLHESGLALPLFERAKDLAAERVLPAEVQTRLEKHLAENSRRVRAMVEEFERINACLESVGADYAVLKGFALVPEYCPRAALRAQADYDYLVPRQALPEVERALEANDWVRKGADEDRGRRVYFHRARPLRLPRSGEEMYSADFPARIELHTTLGVLDEDGILLAPPGDVFARLRRRTWQGLKFSALDDADALIFQVAHAIRHILDSWCRLSNLREVAYFVERTSKESPLWETARSRVEGQPQLRAAIGVVFSLAEKVFGARLAPALARWTTEALPPALCLWVERYGTDSALQNFMGDKFTLFLYREFVPNRALWRKIAPRRLFPIHRPNRAAEAHGAQLGPRVAAQWKQALHVLGRARFHLGALLGYAWESRRWERSVRRARADSSSRNAGWSLRPASVGREAGR